MLNETFLSICTPLLKGLRDPAAICTHTGEIVLANTHFSELYFSEQSPRPISSLFELISSSPHFLTEFQKRSIVQLKGGTMKEVAVHVEPLLDQHLFLTFHTTNNLQEVVDTFHMQRLSTLGQLSAGIAHDFNNVLAGVLGHVSYLKAVLPAQGEHAESIRSIEEGARRASQMTQQILSFSRLDAGEIVEVDLVSLVNGTSLLMKKALSTDHQLVVESCTEKLCIYASEGKLSQVLANLITNARDAIIHKGTITVALRSLREKRKLQALFKDHETPKEGYAVLQVIDNGRGMSSQVLERVFEPYFSTKKKQGMGLGMSTVAAIVRECGGMIDIRSQERAGTTVTLYLPLVDQKTEQEIPADEQPAVMALGARILVVDDEEAVRNVLALSLSHLGYKVHVASDGYEALDRLEHNGDHFDLVILDMLMPGLSGKEVAQKLRDFNREIPIIISSGFAAPDQIDEVMKLTPISFLAKPFTIDELGAAVTKLLVVGG